MTNMDDMRMSSELVHNQVWDERQLATTLTIIMQIYEALMSIHVVVGLVPVKHFDHEGLHQLQNT